MDIEARRQRLDETATIAGAESVYWFGEFGENCQRCGVEVPAGYQLSLPTSEVSGCLRCLEYQAHLAVNHAADPPDDLLGTVNQQDALRRVAEQFRAHIKAVERGRTPPLSKKLARERWTAKNNPDTADDIPADEAMEGYSRWPAKGSRSLNQQAAPDHYEAPTFKPRDARAKRSASNTSSQHAQKLGLTGTPTREQIIAAFRQSALICHPDYGGTAEAFREILNARDSLLARLQEA